MKKLVSISGLFLFSALLFPLTARSAALPVTSLVDDGSVGTLRYVLKFAADGDVIEIPAGIIVLDSAGATALDADAGDEDLDVLTNVTIRGQGAGVTIIDANGPTTGARVFEIDSDGEGVGAVIEGVTIQNGKPSGDGGGVYVNYPGSLEIYDSAVIGNDITATSDYGGGIYVDGDGSIGAALIVGNTTISNNKASDGGGIYSYYTSGVTVKGSTISDNEASGSGGGIFNYYGQLDLIDTKVNGNTVTGSYGGGLYNEGGAVRMTGSAAGACEMNENEAVDYGGAFFQYEGATSIDNCNFNKNTLTSTSGYGGAIANDYDSEYSLIHLRNSTVSENVSEGYAGGIYNSEYASMFIEKSTISKNIAKSGYGGGIYNYSYAGLSLEESVVDGNVASEGYGGGIMTYGYLTIDRSAITNNTVNDSYYGGGGINSQSDYGVVISNSTIAGNKALGDDGSDDTNGGGIFSETNYALEISNTTIANNVADGDGGGIFNDYYGAQLNNVTVFGNTADANSGGITAGDGGGIWNNDGYAIQLVNTIVAGNVDASPGHETPDCKSDYAGNSDALTVAGPNLIQNTDGCEVLGNVERLITGDALVDSAGLADNDGPSIGDPDSPVILQTLALQSGSPAIDAGEDRASETSDERGVARPVDGNGDGEARSDLGAFEAAASGGTTGGTTGGETGGETTGGSTTGGSSDSGGCSLIR